MFKKMQAYVFFCCYPFSLGGLLICTAELGQKITAEEALRSHHWKALTLIWFEISGGQVKGEACCVYLQVSWLALTQTIFSIYCDMTEKWERKHDDDGYKKISFKVIMEKLGCKWCMFININKCKIFKIMRNKFCQVTSISIVLYTHCVNTATGNSRINHKNSS